LKQRLIEVDQESHRIERHSIRIQKNLQDNDVSYLDIPEHGRTERHGGAILFGAALPTWAKRAAEAR